MPDDQPLDAVSLQAMPGCGPLLYGWGGHDSPPLRQTVLERIRAGGLVPRVDVAKDLGVSPASVTSTTSDLLAEGLLEEAPGSPRDTTRGRPPVALRLRADAHYVVGMKLSDLRHTAVVVDFAGTVLAEVGQDSRGLRLPLDIRLDEAETLFRAACAAADLEPGRISGIGLGLPGTVDHETGHVPWSPIVETDDPAVGPALQARLGPPVRLDNDANVLTLAELWFGAGRAMTDFAVVTIEHGVGMGLVLGNRLFRGARGLGMEFGHTKVQIDGALCRCGRRGCLEAYVADYALVREAATALPLQVMERGDPAPLLEDLYDEAKAGNAAARSIFRRAGRFLAAGLANIVTLFDPQRILLSGERMHYDYLYAEDVLSDMRDHLLDTGRAAPQVDIHAWGDLVWAQGAAALALSDLTDRLMTPGEGE